jgi:hypothetical protein
MCDEVMAQRDGGSPAGKWTVSIQDSDAVEIRATSCIFMLKVRGHMLAYIILTFKSYRYSLLRLVIRHELTLHRRILNRMSSAAASKLKDFMMFEN